LSGAVAKLAGITFWSIDFFLDSINLGFFLREKLTDVLIIPSYWGSQLDGEKLSTPRRINASLPLTSPVDFSCGRHSILFQLYYFCYQ
jgi:hypothetical protein